jgi:hypothetical protein
VIVGRRRVCRDLAEELEAREDMEVLDGVRDRRERMEDDELVRGADAGMMIPDLRIADLENLGALLARSGVGSSEAGCGRGIESVQRPLDRLAALVVDGSNSELSDEDDDLDTSEVGRWKSRRGAEDHNPLSVNDLRAVGRSRLTMENAFSGDWGGLSRPFGPIAQFGCFDFGGSSSTCRHSGLDTRT